MFNRQFVFGIAASLLIAAFTQSNSVAQNGLIPFTGREERWTCVGDQNKTDALLGSGTALARIIHLFDAHWLSKGCSPEHATHAEPKAARSGFPDDKPIASERDSSRRSLTIVGNVREVANLIEQTLFPFFSGDVVANPHHPPASLLTAGWPVAQLGHVFTLWNAPEFRSSVMRVRIR